MTVAMTMTKGCSVEHISEDGDGDYVFVEDWQHLQCFLGEGVCELWATMVGCRMMMGSGMTEVISVPGWT